MEPTMIYSRRRDPRGVVALLRSLDPEVRIEGPDEDWKSATFTLSQPGASGPLTLTIHHDPEYYDGDDWPTQRRGMQGFFGRAPDSPQRDRILRLIGTFRFALALEYEPDLIPEGDARLTYLAALVRFLDGVLFDNFSLRDADGRLLFALNGEHDPEAICPTIPEPVRVPAEEEDEADEEEEETEPPTPQRVARRALALVAVTVRALLEQDDPEDPKAEEFRQRILAWVDAIDIADELEPDEWEVLQRPVGRLDRQQQIDATWRLEGLAVLAWALGRYELPQHDVLVVPRDLIGALDFLDDDASRNLLLTPALRPIKELEWQNRRLLGIHWRLRDYTLRPQAMDFRAFARDCWFGSFDLAGIRLIGDDLALGDAALSAADQQAFATAYSAARERHLASNWLLGQSRIYSETDTST
jgi:hypothetical protein